MGTPSTLHNVDERGYVFVTEAADCQIVSRKTVISITATTDPPQPFPEDASGNPTNLPVRRRIYIKNNELSGAGKATVYIGGADVTTTNGFPLPPQEEVILDVTDDIQLYATLEVTSPLDTVDLRTLELA